LKSTTKNIEVHKEHIYVNKNENNIESCLRNKSSASEPMHQKTTIKQQRESQPKDNYKTRGRYTVEKRNSPVGQTNVLWAGLRFINE